jgi:hypothetical protein
MMVGSGAEGITSIVGVIGRYNTTEAVVTKGVRVRTLRESVGDFATIDARTHPA